MANNKERTTRHDQSDLMGVKPHGSIGPGRSQAETKIVGKLKQKKLRAEGSTSKSGEKANVGNITTAIGRFANK